MSASIGTPLPLETLERVVEVIEALPHNAKLGMRAADIARGRCVTYIDYRAELVGDPSRNVLHGGVVTALIDTTAGAAVYSCLSGDTPLATLDMRIDYLKPTESDRRLHANARGPPSYPAGGVRLRVRLPGRPRQSGRDLQRRHT